MSGINTKLSYRQLQTMKHALFYFMQREHATITMKEFMALQLVLLELQSNGSYKLTDK